MQSLSSFTARALAETYDFGTHRRLLDVGGGSAALPIELCRRYPRLTGTVYDLAPMCRVAARNIAAAGLQESIGTVAGDFLVDDRLPPGYDVVLLSMILHDWDEATDRALLRKCFAALPPGGTLLVCELIVNAEGTGPADAALMGINMLLETAGGKNYTETEYRAWLKESGFTDIRVEPLAAAGANGVRQTATLRDRPNVLRGSL